MNYFEKLEKDTAIIKALGSEILKSSADDETILTTLNIVSDTVYRFKIAKANGVSSRESYSEDCLRFTKIDIERLKKFYTDAFFDKLEKTLIKAIENVDNV